MHSTSSLLTAVLIVCSSALLHAAEPTTIEQCLAESDLVLVVAHVEPLVASGLIAESLDTAPDWLKSLVLHDVDSVYLTVDLLNGMPAIFIPIPEGADETAVSALQDTARALAGLIQLNADLCEPLGSFVFLGSSAKRDSILHEEPPARPGLAAALAASSDSRVSIILAWTPDQQRVLTEMFPTLPAELGSVDGQILGEQVTSVRVSVPRAVDAVQFEIIADDAATADQMGDAFEGWVNYAVTHSGNELAANMVLGMFDFSRETVDNISRLTWALKMPADQFRPLVQQWFASAISSVDVVNNLRQLGLAMHNFHDVYGSFPPPASYQDGQPLLSWRVYLLPYLDQMPLYQQFHLDEPWDSEHNMALLSEMPAVFQSASAELNQQGLTRLVLPVAELTAFHGETGVTIKEMTDGTTQTALIVSVPAEHAVPWTKPADWEVDFSQDLHAWLFEGQTELPVLLGDGSVQQFDATLTPDNLRRLLQHQDGEPIEW